jgi:hypothetical protein
MDAYPNRVSGLCKRVDRWPTVDEHNIDGQARRVKKYAYKGNRAWRSGQSKQKIAYI